MRELHPNLTQNWRLFLLRGIVAIGFGLVTFAWPGLTLDGLVVLFGAFVLLDGVLALALATRDRRWLGMWWVWAVEGVLGLGVFLLTLYAPDATAFALRILIAVWAMLDGLLRVVIAIRLRREIPGERFLVLGGLLSFLAGVVMFVVPLEGALAVIWLIELHALGVGALFVALAEKLRRKSTGSAPA
ncbi:HdeD family acid-resistance protein [Oceaniglobus ichthyenteri]|uniref:HdeD family acid-resistance protein n=1 Tax=Oceaniglobus ichthyenteri TaxID=2136177 RepID=UPI000D3BBFCA|nr:HdeD family acid-resistance protein [Oceaniglobus ichthyenteri]